MAPLVYFVVPALRVNIHLHTFLYSEIMKFYFPFTIFNLHFPHYNFTVYEKQFL